MNGWLFAYDDFVPAREALREALCTLGNGYFATRGAAAEAAADDVHYPGTYLAGGYNRLSTEIAGRVVENEDLVNLPNWLPLTFRIGSDAWFHLSRVQVLAYRQELDLRRGMLTRDVRFRDTAGRQSRLVTRRIVHMRQMHLAAQEMVLTPENWSGQVTVRSALDGGVINGNVKRYRALASRHLMPAETAAVDAESIELITATSQSRLRIAEAARTRLRLDGEPVAGERRLWQRGDAVGHDVSLDLAAGGSLAVEKVVALHASRDRASAESAIDARKTLSRAGGFEELLASHALAWDQLWGRCDIVLQENGGDVTQLAVRLHVFHLLQTASPHSIDFDAGVPARGWHGEAYRGHVFWDELFIFPFLNLRVPVLTRALLRYRYRRLDEARAMAAAAGYRGAMYPWQSGSDGREESQTLHLNPKSGRWLPDNSALQRHINVAVAYNLWQYYQVTGDGEFMNDFGAEMILEIARFWSSIATWDAALERFVIRGVMGPDEYHDAYPGSDRPGLDNNAYTNVMAAWVLSRALQVLELLPEERRRELVEQLSLSPAELAHWDAVSRRLRIPFHGDGIISQFEGYEALREFDWEGYRRRHGDIHRLDRILEAEGDTPNRYKLSKQADVLMLFYLFSAGELTELFERLGYRLRPDSIPRNIVYYLDRTSHGSTLSGVVHAWVMARLDRRRSWELFRTALMSDIADVQGGTTAEGIHLGAMAGTIDLVQRGYAGVETRGDVLRFAPALPEELRCLKFTLRYRQHLLLVEIQPRKLSVESRQGAAAPICVECAGRACRLEPGTRADFDLAGPGRLPEAGTG